MRTTCDLSSVSTTAAAAITVENKMTEKGKTDFFPNKVKPYHNALMIFNNEIECGELIDTLLRLKNNINNARKICVAINKFLVYSEHNKQNISEDYDIALIKLITSHFDTFKIYSPIHDKNLKGDNFNFASPYTQIFVDKKIKRSFMHEGVFATSFSDFFGSDTGYGILKYTDSFATQNEIFVWFGYPDYDHSSYTIIYQFRAALQDEIHKTLALQSTNPETILKGQIMDVKLEILVGNNE